MYVGSRLRARAAAGLALGAAALLSGCPLTTFEIDRGSGTSGLGGEGGRPAGAGGDTPSGSGGGPQGGNGPAPVPVPKDDDYVILQGEALNVLAAAGVLANDAPAGLSVVRFSERSGERPAEFRADYEVNFDGSFSFTPHRRFFGVYRFNYTVRNDEDVEVEATVSVRVIPTDVDLDAVIEGIGGFVLNGSAGARLGAAIDAAGDVNGDGYADLVVGAPGTENGAGSAYLVYGKTDHDAIDLERLPARTSESRFVSLSGGRFDALGVSVSGVGDIDGDDVPDLVVGGSGEGGRAYVVFGAELFGGVALPSADGFTLEGDAANRDVGGVVRGVGDVNADGTPDVLVSSTNLDYGWIHVIFGSNLGPGAAGPRRAPVAQAAGLHLRGAEPLDLFPLAAAAAGDIDDDDFAEVFLASRTNFVLLLGGTAYPAHAGEPGADGSSGGWSLLRGVAPGPAAVAGAGDVDGDASLDVAYCDGTVYCRVVFGPPSTLASGWRIAGFGAESTALAVAGGADVDADGLADLLFTDGAGAYVVYGKPTGHGDLNVAALGASGHSLRAPAGGAITTVAMLGDVNGDGVDDYALGASTDLTGAGRVLVVYGVASE